MIVAGIDENGYGPILGPLVVTITIFEVEEKRDGEEIALPLIDSIRDSKRVFGKSKKGNEEGEKVVLSLLSLLSDETPKSNDQLLRMLGVQEKDFSPFCAFSGTRRRICWEEVPFPMWISKEEVENIWKWRGLMHKAHKMSRFDELNLYKLKEVRVASLCPFGFNRLYKKLKNKILVEYSLIERLLKWFLERYRDEKFVITIGKLSNQRYYQKFLRQVDPLARTVTAFGLAITTVKEEKEVSEYALGKGGRIIFFKDGEEKSLPIAASSIMGKYLREIWMKRLNKFFEKEGFSYEISGYRDIRTKEFIKKVLPYCSSLGVPESCLLRLV